MTHLQKTRSPSKGGGNRHRKARSPGDRQTSGDEHDLANLEKKQVREKPQRGRGPDRSLASRHQLKEAALAEKRFDGRHSG